MSAPRRTALYRCFNSDNAPIYIGVTFDLGPRIAGHSLRSDWWTETVRVEVMWFDDREDALAAEARAIVEERPRYNIVPGRCGRLPKSAHSPSQSGVALAAWMAERQFDRWAAAGRLGAPPFLVAQILDGRRPPSLALAARIEQRTGVRADGWTAPPRSPSAGAVP